MCIKKTTTKLGEQKIRIYVIADDCRWHHICFDILGLTQHLKQYAEILRGSEKLNSYNIFSTEMTHSEIDMTLKNMLYNSGKKPNAIKTGEPKSHLKIVR